MLQQQDTARALAALACEHAWAAGFFDGEGWVGTATSPIGATQVRLRLHAQVYQTDEALLRRFAAAVAAGRINGPYQQRLSRKPIWTWGASGACAEHALRCMLPYLGQRNLDRIALACDAVNARAATLPPRRVRPGCMCDYGAPHG